MQFFNVIFLNKIIPSAKLIQFTLPIYISVILVQDAASKNRFRELLCELTTL